MQDKPQSSLLTPQLTDLEEFRRNANWFLALGIILI